MTLDATPLTDLQVSLNATSLLTTHYSLLTTLQAYGKFNLSAPSRNQSPQALRNYLVRIEQTACASALDCLVAYIEKEFKKKVALPSYHP